MTAGCCAIVQKQKCRVTPVALTRPPAATRLSLSLGSTALKDPWLSVPRSRGIWLLTAFGNSKVVNLFSGASDSNRRVSERTNETILAVVQLPIGANTVEARRDPRDSNLE